MMFFLFTLLGGSVSAWPHSGQQWKSCNADRVGVGTAVFVLVNMFIAILLESCAFRKGVMWCARCDVCCCLFEETDEHVKEQLASETDVSAKNLGTEVASVIFEDGVYRIPFIGKYFRKVGERTKRTIRATIDSLPSNARLNMLLRLSDRNFTGDISPLEVAAQLDTNADGQVSTNELYLALIEVGATPAQAHKAVMAVDTNNDGVISTPELKRLVEKVRVSSSTDRREVGVTVGGVDRIISLTDLSSDEETGDASTPALKRQADKQKEARAAKRRAAAADAGPANLLEVGDIFPGIDNQNALRAINCVRLEMLKKQALEE